MCLVVADLAIGAAVRGVVAANEVVIAGNVAAYELISNFDLGAAVVEGFWVAGPLITVEIILRYFLKEDDIKIIIA